jgi:hypothetical protein
MSTDEKVSDIEKSSQVNSVVQQSWTEEEERKLVWKLGQFFPHLSSLGSFSLPYF